MSISQVLESSCNTTETYHLSTGHQFTAFFCTHNREYKIHRTTSTWSWKRYQSTTIRKHVLKPIICHAQKRQETHATEKNMQDINRYHIGCFAEYYQTFILWPHKWEKLTSICNSSFTLFMWHLCVMFRNYQMYI